MEGREGIDCCDKVIWGGEGERGGSEGREDGERMRREWRGSRLCKVGPVQSKVGKVLNII